MIKVAMWPHTLISLRVHPYTTAQGGGLYVARPFSGIHGSARTGGSNLRCSRVGSTGHLCAGFYLSRMSLARLLSCVWYQECAVRFAEVCACG